MSILTKANCIQYLSLIFKRDDGLSYKLRCGQQDLQNCVKVMGLKIYKNGFEDLQKWVKAM